MTLRSAAGTVLTLGILLFVSATVVGALLGHPMGLGFVESGSMAPTLSPGDGFVAVPSALAGPAEPGDVVTFDADTLNGGGLVTHRVVDVTDSGLITKGDANQITDQAGEEPPVKRAQVVAVALQFGGEVIVIPGLGDVVGGLHDVLAAIQRLLATTFGLTAFLGTQGLAYLLFVGSLVVYGVQEYRESNRQSRSRTRDTGWNPRLILLALTSIIVLAATASMALPAGPTEFGVVSAEFDSEGARVIPAGQSETATYSIPNGGMLPAIAVLETGSEGIEVSPKVHRIPAGEVSEARLTLSAPSEIGHYRRFLVQHRYLAVLPTDMILSMYQIHPWLPVVVIDVMFGLPVYLLGVSLIGRGRLRERDTPGAPSRTVRLARHYVPGLRVRRRR